MSSTRDRALAVSALTALAVGTGGTGVASATSHKVAIGNFQWSAPQVSVNLGDTVTWIWTGPDTQHSITGLSANAAQYDSDRGRTPSHAPGDRFQIKFTTPGTYDFHCVLHGIVRGTVTVNPIPGDGAPSPDPDPVILGDAVAPVVDAVSVNPKTRVLKYTLDDAAKVTVDILKQKGTRWVLVQTRNYEGHVGFNQGLLRTTLSPGRYRAYFRAADADNNQSKDAIAPFTVRAPARR